MATASCPAAVHETSSTDLCPPRAEDERRKRCGELPNHDWRCECTYEDDRDEPAPLVQGRREDDWRR